MNSEQDCGYNYYVPSFFFIELKESFNGFYEIFKNSSEHEFFHEYVHFLTDITCSYNYASMSHVLNNIKFAYHKTKEQEKNGIDILTLPLTFENSAQKTNNELFELYYNYDSNYDSVEIPSSTKIEEVLSESKNVLYEKNGVTKTYNVKTFSLRLSDESGDEKIVKFGAHAILEGIAHILEKKCYGLTPAKMKLPYDLAELLINQKYGLNFSAEYIVTLLEFSFQFYNASEALFLTLDRIKEDNMKFNSTDSLWGYLASTVKISEGKSWEEESKESFDELQQDLNGVFVSELYTQTEFSDWIKKVTSVGYELRKTGFHLATLANLNKASNSISQFLCMFINELGMPPVYDADGHVFSVSKDNFLYFWRSVFDVYNTLVRTDHPMYKNNFCSQKESCVMKNDISGQNLFPVDDGCALKPWTKINNEYLCPYCCVWKTFGLSNMEIKIEYSGDFADDNY